MFFNIRKNFILCMLMTLLLVLASLREDALAAQYKVDKAHTNILLRIDHLGFSQMILEVLKYDASISYDPQKPTESSVSVTLHASSIDGDLPKFNRHLSSKDFFYVKKYPEIVFVSKRIEMSGKDSGKIFGEVTLLGVSKPLVLDVTINKHGKHPFNRNTILGISARGELYRAQFGMNYGLPLISDKVSIEIEMEAIKQ